MCIGLRLFKRYLSNGSFLGDILILAGGTGVAQIIVILAMPFLTRIYSPEDFGGFTVFVSTTGLLVVISALRYEVAIPLPASSLIATNLTVLSGLIVLGMSVLTSIVVLFFGSTLAQRLSVPQLIPYLWLIPLGMLVGGWFQVLSYWHVREKLFPDLMRAKVTQSASMVGGQLLMGVMDARGVGLVGGYVLGRTVAGGLLVYSLAYRGRSLFTAINLADMKTAAIRYRRFPLISSWSALLNHGGLQAAPLLFAAFLGAEAAGWFGLAQRVAGVPLALIGKSVSQVYFSEASRLRNENPLAMRRLFVRTSWKLFQYVGVPLMLGGLTAPWTFGVVFGERWRVSGWYIVALLPMFLGQIVVTPLSQTLNILERQDLQLIWDVSRFIAVVGTVIIARNMLHMASLSVLVFYGFSMFVMYALLFLMIWRQMSHLIAADHEASVG